MQGVAEVVAVVPRVEDEVGRALLGDLDALGRVAGAVVADAGRAHVTARAAVLGVRLHIDTQIAACVLVTDAAAIRAVRVGGALVAAAAAVGAVEGKVRGRVAVGTVAFAALPVGGREGVVAERGRADEPGVEVGDLGARPSVPWLPPRDAVALVVHASAEVAVALLPYTIYAVI